MNFLAAACADCGLARDPMSPFVRGDLVLVLERQADVVEAVEQAVAAERFDLERESRGRGRR